MLMTFNHSKLQKVNSILVRATARKWWNLHIDSRWTPHPNAMSGTSTPPVHQKAAPLNH